MKKTLIYIITVASLAIMLSISAYALNTDAYNAVYAGLSAPQESIDLSSYSITPDELSEIFDRITSRSPELYYVDSAFEYSYNDSGFILTMYPSYKISAVDLTAADAVYSSFISGITSGVKSSWSDLEKALYLHDAIALRLRYDSTVSNVYDAAASGKGNCTAYSLAYIAACEKVGLSCDVAISSSMQHMWNIVKIGGNWYHVDVTWDDPTSDLKGRVNHQNFLRSDSAIVNASATTHSDWAADYTCSSTLYDSACWINVNSPFVYADGDWYAINNSNFSLALYDLASSSSTDVAYISNKWPVDGSTTHIYTDAYSGVGAYDDFIYYNSPYKIYSYNVKTGDVATVYELGTDEAVTAGCIYFLSVNGSTLTYYLSKDPGVTQPSSGMVDLKADASTYTVTFNINGEPIGSYDYSEGEPITPPEVGKIDGFLFVEWDSLPAEMPAEDITVEAILNVCPHANAENQIITPSTCTTDGEGSVICTDCGHVINNYRIEGKHEFGDWTTITEADCSTDGLRRRYCPVCGEMTEEEVIPAYSAHRFGDWVILKEATEDEDGERERTCERCDFIEKQPFSLETDDTTEEITEPDDPDASDPGSNGSTSGTDTDETEPDTTKPTTQGGNSKLKSFFVYFSIIVIVISCVIGIFLLYRYAFGKKKPKKAPIVEEDPEIPDDIEE